MAKQMGIYRPRSPQKSPFYQCIADHFEEFEQVNDERFEREYGFWRLVISEVIQKYLECGYDYDRNLDFSRESINQTMV